jgi:hypothetical protein
LPGLETLKKLEAEKAAQINKLIANEEDAITLLHPNLLLFVINLCLEFRIKVVIQSKSYLPALMGLALGMFVKLWNPQDAKLCMKLLIVCERITFFTQEYIEEFYKNGVL